MSPSDAEAFEACWPQIARDLEVVLAKRGIEPHTREDLIQETALRLLARWERLDKTRPIVPLAATIALNLMRDDFRRAKHEVVSEVESSGPAGDVEHEGLARLEFSRVAKAMKDLSISHRRVLLADVSDPPTQSLVDSRGPRLATLDGDPVPSGSAPPRSPAATKMLRMRARRRLAAILETAGVLVGAVRLRLHQLFNEPAQTTAVAFSAGAVLVGAFISPPGGDVPVVIEREVHAPANTSTTDDDSPKVALSVPKARGVAHSAAEAPGDSQDDSPPVGKDEPDARAEADVQVDPSGETVAGADTGFAKVEARRSEDDHYSACIAIKTDPASADACDDDES